MSVNRAAHESRSVENVIYCLYNSLHFRSSNYFKMSNQLLLSGNNKDFVNCISEKAAIFTSRKDNEGVIKVLSRLYVAFII